MIERQDKCVHGLEIPNQLLKDFFLNNGFSRAESLKTHFQVISLIKCREELNIFIFRSFQLWIQVSH